VQERIVELILEFHRQIPSVSILLLMMFLDFLMGVTVAYGAKELSSSASFRGISKKVGMFLLVMTASVLDKANSSDFAAKMVAMAFIATESFSIFENASKLGIKLPDGLVQALIKLRPEDEKRPSNPAINVQHVDINIPPNSEEK
jgi:toxin secretion/phage lysis holin